MTKKLFIIMGLLVFGGMTGGCEKQRAASVSPAAPAPGWTTLGAKGATVSAFDEQLSKAKAQGWPVAIDFSAEWCTACHELDADVLSHASVTPHLKPFLKLRIDATTETPDILAIQERYKIEGLPTVVFIDAKGAVRSDARINGYVQAAEFLAALGRVSG